MRIDVSLVQILLVLVIALLVFGPKRLPDLARQVGRGLREFKHHVNSVSDDIRGAMDDDGASEDHRPPPAAAGVAAPEPDAAVDDDDLLDGVVVSGASGPAVTPPAEP